MNTLRTVRDKNKLTQIEAARLFGVSLSYYTKLENGTKKPGRAFLARFCELYPFEDVRGLILDNQND